MTGTSHRFKVSGEGLMKSYTCSCGNWGMTGTEKNAKAIRKDFDAHADKGGLSRAAETQKDPGDAGGSGSDSSSGQ